MQSYSRWMLMVLFLSLSGAGTVAAQVIPGGSARDYEERHQRRQMEFRREALKETTELLARWEEAWSADRVGQLARQYTEDAVLVPPIGSAVLRGRKEIETFLRRTLPGAYEISTNLMDFDVGGNLAFAMGSFTFATAGGSPGTRTLRGQFVIVFRRERGNWRIRSQLFEPRG